MSTAIHQTWLYRIFNSTYFDTWMAVSYLHRYPAVGIHQYICKKLEHRRDIEKVLPQLVHILFHTAASTVSLPILALLLKKSRHSKRLSIALFFHLKSYLHTLGVPKQAYCRYLMNRVVEANRQRRVLSVRHRKRRHRYLGHRVCLKARSEAASLELEALLLHFVKAVAWIMSSDLAKKMSAFENVFKLAKDTASTEIEVGVASFWRVTSFQKNLVFLSELVDVTTRLRKLPKHIQQQGLEMELHELQHLLTERVSLPFHFECYVVGICVEHCFVLDSAINTPFVLVVEIAREVRRVPRSLPPDMQTAMLLLKQLSCVPRQTPGELAAIRESIIGKINVTAENALGRDASWKERKEAITAASDFKSLRGYDVVSVIIKCGVDFKQELVAYQLLTEIKKIWEEERQQIWIENYRIYLIERNSGMVETLKNVCSVHAIKKKHAGKKGFTLKSYYDAMFSDKEHARKCFLESLVGYSLATFFLQVKDRHNGNIMVDGDGHIVHVDFGFMMGEHPGFYNVEKAPFKFSAEYTELLDNDLTSFKRLFKDGFLALRKYSDRLCRIVEMLIENSQLRCINRSSLADFRDRFKLDLCNQDVERYALGLVDLSVNSIATGFYDHFQYFSNGYL